MTREGCRAFECLRRNACRKAEESPKTAGVSRATSTDCATLDMTLSPEFGDVDAMLNSRDWLQKAIEARGAKIDGGGFGMGECDLDFTLEGCRFNVTLRPLK